MSLPGLGDDVAPEIVTASTAKYELKEQNEWRFEIAFNSKIEVKLISGTAEIFGTELAPQQPYTFTSIKAAIFTWHGCRIEVTGECSVEYIAEETPMTSYANLHFALDRLRDEATSPAKHGPRVLIVGPENAGKTSLAKYLIACATRSGRQPVAINVDPKEGLLSIPSTFSAATFSSILDVEEGWGSSPTNGPTQVPVKLPLVYFFGSQSPEDNPPVFKSVVSRLAVSVHNKLSDDAFAKLSGCIIDTPGAITQGKSSKEFLQHLISEFRVNVIVVLGSERLYSDLNRRNKDQQTSSGERIEIIKLDKSGGAVDRDESFRQQSRQAQIRQYFYGDPKNTLSPHIMQVDFSHLAIFKYRDVASDDASSSFLPGDYEATENGGAIFDKIQTPTLELQNAVLAIVHAHPDDSQYHIRDASLMGFIYVAEVDEVKSKLKILAPLSGRLPSKAMVWGNFPDDVNLVG